MQPLQFAMTLCALFVGGALLAASSGEQGAPTPPLDVQGHRGARGLLPENTLPAFRRALELGVTTLEMDVVISKDSQVVVSHEPWFSSEICSHPSGVPVSPDEAEGLRLYEMTYAEIARYDCGSRGHPQFPQQEKQPARKPLLREVLQMAEAFSRTHDRPPVWYNIETKTRPAWDSTLHPEPEVFVRLVYDVIAEAGIKDRTILQSFDPRTLRIARRMDPSLRLSLLVGHEESDRLAEDVERLGFVPDVYSPEYRLVDSTLVRAAHAQGIRVIPWTVNDAAEMRRLLKTGVDGLITDYPDRAVPLKEP